MKVWTLQRKEVVQYLDKNDVYRMEDFSLTGWGDYCSMKTAYQWLCDEMVRKISSPKFDTQLPIWCWHTINGKRKKPDMRESCHAPTGTEIYRLTLEIPDELVLLSDFALWHYPLNDWHISTSEQEDESFESLSLEQQERVKIDSWKYVFQIDMEDDGYLFGKNSDKYIQGTFWELKSCDIIKVEKFIAR